MRVHIILQGKGGVGKTVVSSLLAQYFRFKNKNIICFDTDPVNASFGGYKSLNVSVVNLIENEEIQSRNFDSLIEAIANSNVDEVVVDSGASTFVPLSSYLLDNNIVELFADMNITLCLHSIVAGSQALLDCINGLNAIITNFTKNGKPENLVFYTWLNTFQGPIQINNKNFFETKCFLNNQEFISSVLEFPELKKDTFGTDYSEMLKNKLTFKEVYTDEKQNIMVKQRLKNLEKRLFNVIENGGL